ncbi:cytochrome P450 [Desmonostoc muscorum LEGE 12446]|uniref:Cytochrome P450 n=1 Tax=Desmonostoc muscorum LEGE 12446 TaxID=1828758 RepID=A0A8J7D2C0_DESMC|nr:cytochrome P450 [Desmonostoc muscorum]MCF2150810.1 cytochrome P450 [Desmonostoc muscorum LEGE 12446]
MKLELQPDTQPNKIPGLPVLPLIGSLPFIDKHQYLSFTELAKKYGDVFQVRIFFQPIVVLNGLDTIRQALLKQQDDFAGRPHFYTLLTAIKGRTIGGRDYGLLWKRHREIVGNALHAFVNNKKAAIEQQIINDSVELANILLSYKGQVFDPELDIGLSVANVMSKILFGEKYSRDDDDFITFVKCAHYFSDNSAGNLLADFLPQARIFPDQGLQKRQYVLDALERVVLKKLNHHRTSYNPENLRGVIDALITAVRELDESEKQNLGLTEDLIVEGTPQEMMGTGLQPSAPLLRWAILYAIANPDIQAQVQQELDTVVGKERVVRYEDRVKLPFTEACIYELLRHPPHFPFGLPHATTHDTTINGYFIPKNTPVIANLYSLTRDERFWEEPEKFNPQRFLTPNREIREDLLDKYYPFGLGKRRCLGDYLGRLEIFLFFANLMHKCKFEKVAGEKLSFKGTPGAHVLPKSYKVIVKPRF